MREAFLKIGEVHASRRPTTVTTLLGSCVSVTLFSRRHGCGAICHAPLPQGDPGSFRHVDFSIRWMIGWFEHQSISATDIEVKMFGGGNMFGSKQVPSRFLTVGQQNIDKALEVISAEGLRLVGSDVGGPFGRRIKYLTHTGEVAVKKNPRLLADRSDLEIACLLHHWPAGGKNER